MMQKGYLKAIAVDIDGTLTNSERRLCLNAIDALRRCEAKGFPVMIASGNIVATTVQVSVLVGLTGPVVAENGGVVHFKGKTEIFGDRRICTEAFEYLRERLPVKELFTNQCRLSEVCLEEDVDIEEVRGVLSNFPVDVNRTGFAIHIMSKGTDKMNGVRRGAELLNITVEEVMAIGDSENDIGMVKGCGLGVAVSNASDDLKTVADIVTNDEHGNGVVEALNRFMLI